MPDNPSVKSLMNLDHRLQELVSMYPLRGERTNADRVEAVEKVRAYIQDLITDIEFNQENPVEPQSVQQTSLEV